MNMILAVGRNMKLITTLNLCLIPLKKILEINYTHGSMKQPTKKYPVEGNNMFFNQRMSDRDGLFIEKGRLPEGKNTLQRKLGRIFW